MKPADLPAIRSGERADYKRCKKKWYWAWRMGLRLRSARFGPLELGTWIHAALAKWYKDNYRRSGTVAGNFNIEADLAIKYAIDQGAPDHVIEKAEELSKLGEAMSAAYERQWRRDPDVRVLAAEVPLEFTIPHPVTGRLMAVHKLKPDLVFADRNNDVWLMEHKTAASIRTEHLVIDDQARPYGAMAERALRKLGLLTPHQRFKGILYNFLRKALPDERPTNPDGKYLNKNGSVSKSQPPPLFVRKQITLTAKQKVITLRRVQAETVEITLLTQKLRAGTYDPDWLQKTPHKSCPKTCDFFAMCVAEEEGTDIRGMRETLYIRQNPYLYAEEHPTADEPTGFEMG